MWSLGCRQGESSLSLLEEEHRAWVAVAPPPWQEEVSWDPTPCQLSAPALSSPPCKRKPFLDSSEDRHSHPSAWHCRALGTHKQILMKT